MAEHSFVTVVVNELLKLRESRLNAMAEGGLKSYDEYTHMTGYLLGLKEAERTLKDFEQRLLEAK
jgi:hypothetical protein